MKTMFPTLIICWFLLLRWPITISASQNDDIDLTRSIHIQSKLRSPAVWKKPGRYNSNVRPRNLRELETILQRTRASFLVTWDNQCGCYTRQPANRPPIPTTEVTEPVIETTTNSTRSRKMKKICRCFNWGEVKPWFKKNQKPKRWGGPGPKNLKIEGPDDVLNDNMKREEQRLRTIMQKNINQAVEEYLESINIFLVRQQLVNNYPNNQNL